MTTTMNLAGAFPKEAGIKEMIRTCKLDGNRVIVTDTVTADHEADIRFNYVTVDEPKVIEEGKLAIAEGRTFTFDASALKLEIEKVENTYLPYDDLNFKGTWDRECLWRIVLSSKAKSATCTVTVS